jgi:hypothetical protein
LIGEQLVIPGSTHVSGRCALCWESFKLGDEYTTVWPKTTSVDGLKLSLVVHRACFKQLDQGDLTRIIAALEQRLALPIAVLSGNRVDLARFVSARKA